MDSLRTVITTSTGEELEVYSVDAREIAARAEKAGKRKPGGKSVKKADAEASKSKNSKRKSD